MQNKSFVSLLIYHPPVIHMILSYPPNTSTTESNQNTVNIIWLYVEEVEKYIEL